MRQIYIWHMLDSFWCLILQPHNAKIHQNAGRCRGVNSTLSDTHFICVWHKHKRACFMFDLPFHIFTCTYTINMFMAQTQLKDEYQRSVNRNHTCILHIEPKTTSYRTQSHTHNHTHCNAQRCKHILVSWISLHHSIRPIVEKGDIYNVQKRNSVQFFVPKVHYKIGMLIQVKNYFGKVLTGPILVWNPDLAWFDW